jgi:hypothetical protein
MPGGKLDFEESKRLLMQVATVDARAEEHEVLIDCRRAHSMLTTSDLWHLASLLSDHRSTFAKKTAILVRPDGHIDHAKFFELCGTNRGLLIRAFVNYEEAIDWLFPSSDIELKE